MWEEFKGTKWKKTIDVASFIETNYTEYLGDETFLTGISKKTSKLWKKVISLIKKESFSNVLDIETELISGIDNFNPGYIDHKEEVIFGLQTDEPLKRSVNLSCGVNDIKEVISKQGFRLNPDIVDKYNEYVKTKKNAINQLFSNNIQKLIDNHLLEGLPINYDRGRIIGDYRRLALYGIDYLIEQKNQDIAKLSQNINMTTIRLIEELNDQVEALNKLKKMASRYDIDISKPASSAKEAIQYLYLAYLGTIKQNNNYTNALGRNMTFIDIYIENDIKKGILTEEQAQELIDQLVIKLRLVRFIHPQDLSLGDANFINECIAGMLDDNKSYVTKTSYRLLNSLNNLGLYQEPNIIILWSNKLPVNFKNYASKMAIKTNCISFVNDNIIRKIFGNDYAISESSSPLMLGRQMQLYGSSINLPKLLLCSLNGGRDEITKEVLIDDIEQIKGEYLDYEEVLKVFEKVLKKATSYYADALNIIHYMHDKYNFESLAMSFHNTLISRVMSFGITGLSDVVDSLSAIKYGQVRVKRNKDGLTQSFDIDTDYPLYGNNDVRADEIASKLLTKIYQCLKKNQLYRNAEPTLQISSNGLNITYGNNTGETPNRRRKDIPFTFGSQPNYKVNNGLLSAMSSISKIPFKVCLDGIVSSLFVKPEILGSEQTSISNLSHILDGYFKQGGCHIHLNIITKEELENSMNNNKSLIIGIGGYLVDYSKLTKEQQDFILTNTFYDKL